MAAMLYDHKDCVDNRIPFWSGRMLTQLKTLLNTPGKTYDDLMADPNWPVWMFDYGKMKAGEKVSKASAMKAARKMGGKETGWKKKKYIVASPEKPEKEKTPKDMTKAELLDLVEMLTAKIQKLEGDDEDDEEGSGDDAPAEEHKDT